MSDWNSIKQKWCENYNFKTQSTIGSTSTEESTTFFSIFTFLSHERITLQMPNILFRWKHLALPLIKCLDQSSLKKINPTFEIPQFYITEYDKRFKWGKLVMYGVADCLCQGFTICRFVWAENGNILGRGTTYSNILG